jgi:hypothetical protein
LIAVGLPLYLRETSVRALIEVLLWILMAWLILMPAVFPWYAVPLAALLVICPGNRFDWVVILLFGVLGLYYLAFFFEYHEFDKRWWFWTKVVEHGIVWISILWCLAKGKGPRS